MQPTHHVLVSVGHWSSGLGVNGINDINNCHHWTLWDPLELLESSRVLLKRHHWGFLISIIDFSCCRHHNSVKNSVLRPGSACVWSAASHDCSNSPVITPENIYSSFPKIKIIKLMFNWCLDRNGSMMLGKYMQNICKDLGCIPVSWKPRCCYGPGMDSMDSPFGMEHITQPRRARNWLCNPTLGYSKRETHGIRQNWGKQWRLVYQELQDVVQNFPSQTNSMMSGTTTDGATCNKMENLARIIRATGTNFVLVKACLTLTQDWNDIQ